MNLKMILPYFRQNKGKLALGLTSLVVVDLILLFIPILIKKSIDLITPGRDNLGLLIKSIVIILVLSVIVSFLRFWWRYYLMGISRIIEKGIRQQLFEHVTSLDSTFFNTFRTGDIMAHATSDINHIRMAFGVGIVAFIDATFLGISTVGMMVYLNAKLSLLALIPMPVVAFITLYMGKKMHEYHIDAQESFSVLTENIREGFFGIRVVKVYNFQKFIIKNVIDISKEYFDKNLKRAVFTAAIRPLMVLFLNLSLFIIIFYGGFLVMEKTITPGDLVAFIQYLGLLAWPVIAIGWMTNLMQRGFASLRRIEKIMNTDNKIIDGENPIIKDKLHGHIEFKNISFSYDLEKPILKNINYEISSGEFVGIIGSPGSGKSTLLSMILRLYDPDSGSINIDGNNLVDYSVESIRSSIAYMQQEAFLFSGTIAENILMGKELDQNKLDKVIKAAQLESTLKNMPEGLETYVGERGVTLSGGQKLRISMARTIYSDKDIIILDDPVSQVDTDTASKIIESFRSLLADKTIIIVSHRISAISNADKIIVMNNGEIEDSGDHEKLFKTNEFYRKSYEVQILEGGNVEG